VLKGEEREGMWGAYDCTALMRLQWNVGGGGGACNRIALTVV